ncbi:MAG: thiamine phosphate synthase [Pseudanabaenaceae cyanobacterium bins.68]|nr:thiamine phosphate synthase [Pseudanabaenaceae cyanobacterium bins.68]
MNRINPNPIYRILDANLDRAREGVRVLEEWCRLGLHDQSLAHTCKQIRQQLGEWHRDTFRQARDTAHDPGTSLSHPQEQSRPDIASLLRVNLSRVQEALRVIEEYAKLLESSPMAEGAKQLRYQVYILETQLLTKSTRHQKLAAAQLYLVTSPSDRLLEITEACLQGGLTLVQYRQKEGTDRQRFANSLALCQLCHRYGALFLVNDRPDIALAVGADGIHLGQTDLPVATARSLLGDEKIIGMSTTSPGELEIALAAQVDYLGAGPVYATPTKPGKAAAGFSYLEYVATHTNLPWFAIGGIDLENLSQVLAAGVTRVAVVRSLMTASDPQVSTQAFLAELSPVGKGGYRL